MYCIIAKILLILVLNFTNFRIFTVNCDNVSIPNVGQFIGKILQNNVKGFLGVKYASVKNRRFQVNLFIALYYTKKKIDLNLTFIIFSLLNPLLCLMIWYTMQPNMASLVQNQGMY